jgi:hypothetical protein
MIPVFQNKFGFGEGNCAWACLASVFELSLDSMPTEPPYPQDWFDWTQENVPHLVYTNKDLAYDYELRGSFPKTKDFGTKRWTYKVNLQWEPPDASATGGYWIATVPSQRLKRPVEDPYYPLPALHAVVMLDRECVHDPNPHNTLDPSPLVIQQTWWTHA